MEKRVIKFNLVGAIFVLLLIIGAIVGIVIWVNNSNKEQNKDKDSVTTGNEQIQLESENKESTEKVTVNGEEKEITMKVAKSSLGYTMKYDVDSFYFESAVDGKDKFNSLISNTVYIYINKESEEFEDRVNDIILDKNREDNLVDYDIIQTEINGIMAYKETMKDQKETVINYFIKADDGCFVIEAHCGDKYTDMLISIVETMVESFKIV